MWMCCLEVILELEFILPDLKCHKNIGSTWVAHIFLFSLLKKRKKYSWHLALVACIETYLWKGITYFQMHFTCSSFLG